MCTLYGDFVAVGKASKPGGSLRSVAGVSLLIGD